MPDTTIRDLSSGAAVQDGDLFISRQSSDTTDVSVTSQQISTYSQSKITGLNANQIADGSVSSTEFQYLGGVTSDIQTQLNAKQATGNYITALTGDGTASGPGSAALTLATVNSNVGSFGSATAVGTFTVNAKGLITAAGSTTITPAVGSVTGLGTGVATALAVNVGTAGSIVVNGGALGTPSSGVATNLTGTASGLTAGAATILATGRTIAITGDLTWTSPSFNGSGNVTAAGTLATVNANVGSFGSATAAPTFTVNGKGLITAAGSATITPAVGSITGLGTGVSTALAVNTGTAGSFIVNGGALGTPSSGVATNLTGTASGLTSGAVTIANEATDTTCFLNFTTAATGDLGIKTNSNLKFDSSTGITQIGGAASAARYNLFDGNGTTTARRDDNGIRTTLILENRSIVVGVNEGVGVLANLADDTTNTAIAGGRILFLKEQAWTTTASTQDSYIRFDTTTNGSLTARTRIASNGDLSPNTNDVGALGTASLSWADLFLASGANINIANGDWVATHSTGVLTVGTGDLRVTTAGTNSASVVTVGGTQTLTSKTLTAPSITGATITTSSVNGVTLTAAGSATDFLNAAGNYVSAAPTVTANRAVVSNGSGDLIAATTTDTEIGYVNGVTSAIQTQINGKQPLNTKLTDIAALAVTDSNFIVGNGTTWVAESGATVRTSLGLGTSATVNTGTSGATIPLLNGNVTHSGTWTLSSATGNFGSSTGAATYQMGYGATTNGTTKTLNIGTAGVSGSITNINIGSSVAGATGTAIINSPTVRLNALTASTALHLDSSKNITSVTNTGSGNNVLATSPALTTPDIGTPSAGTLTNCTGYSATNLASGTLPAARLPTGTIVDRAYAEYTTNTSLTVVIPPDDTIPQNTEGTQILSVSITPKTTTNRLRATFMGFGGQNAGAAQIQAAMFLNSTANAVNATNATAGAATNRAQICMAYEWVPGATSSQTINIRVGAGSGNMGMNGTDAGRVFGGVARSVLIVEEIVA